MLIFLLIYIEFKKHIILNAYCTKVVLPCADNRRTRFLYAKRKGFLEATEKDITPEKKQRQRPKRQGFCIKHKLSASVCRFLSN